jgi:hypothetical protein
MWSRHKQSAECLTIIRVRLVQLRKKRLALDELILSLERYLQMCDPVSEEAEATRARYSNHLVCTGRDIRRDHPSAEAAITNSAGTELPTR